MKIKGIVTAMVTPLDQKGINEEATRKLVRKLLAEGVSGLFILGTNGEFYNLSFEEKLTFARIVVAEVAGAVPVFAGAGGISTAEVIRLTNALASCGVDAVSVITPYLVKLTDEELIGHYQTITKETQLPLILYNIPQNTGITINEAVFKELIKDPRIIGIKDSSGNIQQIKTFLAINERKDFSVLLGSDSLILEGLKLGADGAVAATSNLLTRTDVGIYQAFIAGDLSRAAELQASIEDFRRVLKLATVPSVLKLGLTMTGQGVGEPRLPVRPVSNELYEEIWQTIMNYQNIENYEGKQNEM